jgi:putative NADH-flavin reductase
MPLHEQIRKILADGFPDSLILVGGQASLYYAERFRTAEPFLERFAAVTSRDSDFLEFLGTANFGQEDHDLQIFAKEIA